MRNGRTGNEPDSPEPDRWMKLAVRYLAVRDRTSAQVRSYLRRKGALPDDVEPIVTRLCDLRYLDDRAFAERWISRRMGGRPMGRERLRSELEARGVEDSIAQAAIDEAFRKTGENQLARLALDLTQRRGRRLTPMQAVRLLRQRGFDEETIGDMMEHRIGNEGSVS
jgi:regulatory protein